MILENAKKPTKELLEYMTNVFEYILEYMWLLEKHRIQGQYISQLTVLPLLAVIEKHKFKNTFTGISNFRNKIQYIQWEHKTIMTEMKGDLNKSPSI
jgi:hypothetical protein